MAYEKYILILSTILILVVIILFNFISFQELFRPGTHHLKTPVYFEINHDLGEPSKVRSQAKLLLLKVCSFIAKNI